MAYNGPKSTSFYKLSLAAVIRELKHWIEATVKNQRQQIKFRGEDSDMLKRSLRIIIAIGGAKGGKRLLCLTVGRYLVGH